jgi:hypothetical protein
MIMLGIEKMVVDDPPLVVACISSYKVLSMMAQIALRDFQLVCRTSSLHLYDLSSNKLLLT